MACLLVLMYAHIVLEPGPGVGVTDMRDLRDARLYRSSLQATVLFLYAVLLVGFRPYVRTRKSLWKL